MTLPVFETVAIIGIGLIGSSIALASKASGAADRITLYDQSADVRQKASAREMGDVCATAKTAVETADCVIMCVPVGALAAATADITAYLKPGAILTDVGSVKREAVTAMSVGLPSGIHLIPGHPISGTEQSGPDAGFATLFEGAWHILTPLDDTSEPYMAATSDLTAFWSSLGAKVESMDADRHDRVLAITSHLPHLIAYNIVSTAYDMESVGEGDVVKYSAGGFRDFTRIAASDPTMWRDVFLNNKDAVLECLGRFSEDLAALQRAIRWGDGDTLMREFTRARGIRQAILEAGQDSQDVNFGRQSAAQKETASDTED